MAIPSGAIVATSVALAMAGCSCDRNGVSSPQPDGGEEALPGPLPGWQVEFDGITCTHPDVEANCADGWCRIPAGCFIQGSPGDEWYHAAYTEDQRAVTLTHPFWMQQNEITQQEWEGAGFKNPSGPLKEGGGDCTNDPDCPVGNVSWLEALAYANWLSEHHDPPLPACYKLEGCSGQVGEGLSCDEVALTTPTPYECHGFRLPTNAEWEYSARGGTRTAVYSGPIDKPEAGIESDCDAYEHLDRIAWYCHTSGDWTHPVGSKQANAWHLYDMIGNAREWVHDEYTGSSPPQGPLTDPASDVAITDRRCITRGGCVVDTPPLLRAALTLESTCDRRVPTFGFRLVRTE